MPRSLYSPQVFRSTFAHGLVASAALVLLIAAAAPARGEDPLSLFGGRLRFGGEVSGTISPEDLGFFNYTDYETNTLRLFRVDLTAEARLHRSVSLLFDGRMDNLDTPR